MSSYDWLQIFFFVGAFCLLTPLLGTYMVRIFDGTATAASWFLGWLEALCYKVGRIDPKIEMTWVEYGKTLLWFNVLGFVSLLMLQLLQGYLPLNPQNFEAVPWDLAFNTAASFITNTNWQSYAGETTLSYLTQMLGLTSQNFLSAATGMAAFLALTRGITRKSVETIGNFWVDIVRMVVYLLLPFSIILAIVLMSQGVIQNFSAYVDVTTLESVQQTIPQGPVASQIAIKQLGSNGGGFFNANSAHPFENPTALTNFLEMLAIMLIPAASVYMYGLLVKSKQHAWLLFGVMLTLWAIGFIIALASEHVYNPVIDAYPILEGQETRFKVTNSILWAVSTTGTSNGSINAMISSLSPLAGGVAMFNLLLGGLIFGGVGVGLCSMIMMVLLTVFLAGLMVGRTPEYFGKKIEKREMQWVVLAVLLPGALILWGAGLSCVIPEALLSLSNRGPHGLSEILYAYASAAANNGSAFAGLNANTVYYNVTLGVVMLLARIAIIMPSLAIAGLLVRKKITPPSIGTFSTNSLLFFVLLTSVIVVINVMTFFPALSLGPIVEHLLMLRGQSF